MFRSKNTPAAAKSNEPRPLTKPKALQNKKPSKPSQPSRPEMPSRTRPQGEDYYPVHCESFGKIFENIAATGTDPKVAIWNGEGFSWISQVHNEDYDQEVIDHEIDLEIYEKNMTKYYKLMEAYAEKMRQWEMQQAPVRIKAIKKELDKKEKLISELQKRVKKEQDLEVSKLNEELTRLSSLSISEN